MEAVAEQEALGVGQEDQDFVKDHILAMIYEMIRGHVRNSCQQSWLRRRNNVENPDLPTRRQDMTDHYHRRALKHVKQARFGMNVVTVVQMEATKEKYRLRIYRFHTGKFWKIWLHIILSLHIVLTFWKPINNDQLQIGEGIYEMKHICFIFIFIIIFLFLIFVYVSFF